MRKNNNCKFEKIDDAHFAITYQSVTPEELRELPEVQEYLNEHFPEHDVRFEEREVLDSKDKGKQWSIIGKKAEGPRFV